jgi:hypothetical protein
LSIEFEFGQSEAFSVELARHDQANTVGAAGEHLVISHLLSMGLDAAIMHTRYYDAIIILGRTYKIQVKASAVGRSFGGANVVRANLHGGRRSQNELSGRGLLSYKGYIDAFAFCCLLHPYPYYMATEAISDDTQHFSKACFTRPGRDRSFAELMSRWKTTPPHNGGDDWEL